MSDLDLPKPLRKYAAIVESHISSCLFFRLESRDAPVGTSKVGGEADLDPTTSWPSSSEGPLDFLMQVNCQETRGIDSTGLLPRSGMLSFFYDLENQPWGYDPKNLTGFRVLYSKDLTGLCLRPAIKKERLLKECGLTFGAGTSLPSSGTADFDALIRATGMTKDEASLLSDYIHDWRSTNKEEGPSHQLLGHSENVQGDMQLEAQLVTNGLYCGDASGYKDPRAKSLASGATDWQLLLQLDSDDAGEFMWGDTGMLYFWIRKSDLQDMNFANVWMSLQCC